MAKFRSGIHTKVETLIERSGGYNAEYHIDKLREVNNMSFEDISIVTEFTHDYEEQIKIINGIKEGIVKLETIRTYNMAKRQKNEKDLASLFSVYDEILRKSNMCNFYKNMLNQGF